MRQNNFNIYQEVVFVNNREAAHKINTFQKAKQAHFIAKNNFLKV